MPYNNNKSPLPNVPACMQAILAELPGWHGTMSNPSRNVRRRLRRKAKAASGSEDEEAVETASLASTKGLVDPSILVAGAHDVIVYHANIDPSQAQSESQSSGPSQNAREDRAENSSGQARSEEQNLNAPRRTDSWKIGTPPQQKKNSALSASSTSTKIVEALLPDRPAPVRWPRRTASVDVCYGRKMGIRDSIEEEKKKKKNA